MSLFVLDASALLALFLEEPGADRVLSALRQCEISSVNAAEVGARLSDRGYDLDELYSDLREMGLAITAFDAGQAEASSRLRSVTKALGLSLGDRACLALALCRSAKVLTADRAWMSLSLETEIQLIR
ncbi:type II toxin-antitoxin system VapC family toxin [Sphingomonas sp.]|uniref:type II toxin-antitoxin system VapC family toxin n=1 Tax=Sphingomonas sp. TaxID=28214 RepID=UPI002DBDF539|nr:type II toxin-antitoxin system VapC family toxin [Sphingomonas sp.]HEU4967773.1 type II toxin-antitoxin system VapC family toxin [Sphingomonas sp.]